MSDSNIQQALQQVLQKKDALSFSEYLDIALYHSQYGYYMRKDQEVFGGNGDFVTAPHMSPVLGVAISRWLASQSAKEVLEIAPGDGRLAQQILAENPDIEVYYLLDINPLPSQKNIGAEVDKVRWITEVPHEFPGAIIANEWLDALPFRRFCWDQSYGVREIILALGNNKPRLSLSSEETQHVGALNIAKKHAKNWSSPYVFEQGFSYQQVLKFLQHTTGPVLLIDYGYECNEYYHSDRSMGTMICFQKHQTVEFSVAQSGCMDITSAVNWTEVMSEAERHAYKVDHFGPQADFLRFFAQDRLLSSESLGAKQLYQPHEMGQYIKVLSINPVK
jgi:SAM-dependent MidA family methyltransferase